MAEITVIGSDLIHSLLNIRYIRKAQSDRHCGLGAADSNTAKMYIKRYFYLFYFLLFFLSKNIYK